MTISVRPVRESDSSPWKQLYGGYRAFYERPEDAAVVDTTWRWVVNGEHSLFGLVAVNDDDQPIALANLRWFARPSSGTIGLYLDDLFTSPDARGTGAGSALIARAAEIAASEGATVVRWVTATDNATARRVYDRLADATHWVTYDMPPAV